jgi:molybdate transport system ATP-binding protein
MSEPRLRLDVEKRRGAFHLDVALELGTGTAVLFGPSGAGKTTVLDLVAGLLDPDAGEISMDGHTFFRRARRSGADRAAGSGRTVRLPPRRRRIGYVFQQYALFPHMTALENVMFPLRRAPDRQRRAHELLERVRLDGIAGRYPRELSGGQQQRVALARALAARPSLLLLDEPFSALDAAVREHLQRDIATLQQELELVVLYVTHRLEDAFALGQSIAVLRDGRIEQVGPIDDVFRRPANAHVAESMGIRNVLSVTVVAATPEGLVLDWDGIRLSAPPQPAPVGCAALAYIRPEEVKLLYADRPLSRSVEHNRMEGRVEGAARSSGFHELRLSLPNGREVEARFPLLSYASMNLSVGATVQLALRREAIVVLAG